MATASHIHDDEAAVRAYAYSDKFPELHMDEDIVREVQAAWLMFVDAKGGPEAAEAAVCEKLQKVGSPFATILYPDKAMKRPNGSINDRRNVNRETGQINHGQQVNQQLAAIMAATKGGGEGGGCPFSSGSRTAQSQGVGAWSSLDKKGIAEILAKLRAAESAPLAKAVVEESASQSCAQYPGPTHRVIQSGHSKAASKGAPKVRSPSATPKLKATSSAKAKPVQTSVKLTSVSSATSSPTSSSDGSSSSSPSSSQSTPSSSSVAATAGPAADERRGFGDVRTNTSSVSRVISL